MGGLAESVDLYCERTGPAFWAEPLNALTNLAFLVAAALVLTDGARRRDGAVVLLGVIVAAIGVGSFLFHTFATRWAALADVVPIQLFIVTWLAIALHRLVGWGALVAATIAVLFVPVSAAAAAAVETLVGDALRGGAGYLPALAALWALAALLAVRGHPAARPLALAGGLFAVSLAFRTADLPLCPHWPVGTHAVWHVLNAILLGSLARTLARHRPPAAQSM